MVIGLEENGNISDYQNLKDGKPAAAAAEIRGISMQRLPLPILPLKWRLTFGIVSGNLLRPMTCRLKQFRSFFTMTCSSQRSQPE
jgi:hypothetical protein